MWNPRGRYHHLRWLSTPARTHPTSKNSIQMTQTVYTWSALVRCLFKKLKFTTISWLKSAKDGRMKRNVGSEDTRQLIISMKGRTWGLAKRRSMATLDKGFRRTSITPMIAQKSATKSSSIAQQIREPSDTRHRAPEVALPYKRKSGRFWGSYALIRLQTIEAHTTKAQLARARILPSPGQPMPRYPFLLQITSIWCRICHGYWHWMLRTRICGCDSNANLISVSARLQMMSQKVEGRWADAPANTCKRASQPFAVPHSSKASIMLYKRGSTRNSWNWDGIGETRMFGSFQWQSQ